MSDCIDNNECDSCQERGGSVRVGCYKPSNKTVINDTNECMDDKGDEIAGLHASMLITFMQTKGLWPCLLEAGEDPVPILTKDLMDIKNEFKKFCSE